MKLRNKKTGEIKILTEVIHEAYEKHELDFLSKLNAEWEDYKPTEPLIKDEKIRKTLRAWAELNDIKDILHKVDVGRNECCSYIHDINCEMLEIGFKEKLPLGDNASYSIAELCGEKDND